MDYELLKELSGVDMEKYTQEIKPFDIPDESGNKYDRTSINASDAGKNMSHDKPALPF